MKIQNKRIDADLVIAGGGIPGICTALQAARMGLKTALINNRTAFGGNGSAELMINICGAAGMQEFNFNARETGVVEELWLENFYKNPNANRWLWDSVLLDKLYQEENLMLFPNTCVDEVVMKDDATIEYILGTQNTTETRFCFYAPLFVDDTGDGTVAYLSGAEYRYGRESKEEFGERIAPEAADHNVLPSTMVFFSEKRDHPVRYQAPAFATDFTKTDVFQYRVIPQDGFDQFVWFYEIDGALDQVKEAEDIIRHHKEFVYGIWDYIKNSGNFDSANHELSYISPIMGKRESRRFLGDYILKEQDVVEQKDFEDAVGHGGWSIDLHAIDGFYSKEPINRHIFLNGIYQIPFRCGYSKDVNNLFLDGRCMSASHVAFGTTRVMATLSTLGQANAVAAYLCKKYRCTPREIYQEHLEELQQLLLKYDQYIVGKKYEDEDNLAAKASVKVSSVRDMGYADGEQILRLGKDYSIAFPVMKHFCGLKLWAKAEEDTTLRYTLYKPSKPENYNPHTPLYSGEVSVKKSDTLQEIQLPADLKLETGFYFLWIEKNDTISVKWGSRHLTEAVTSYLQEMNADNYIDLETLEPKSTCWKMLNGNLCFEMLEKEPVFAGENLINGYARPYKLPNAWQANSVKNEYIELHWEKPVKMSKLVLIFDSYLTEYFRNERERVELARPMLVKDFDVEIKREDGSYETICTVQDNYQRYRELEIGTHITDCVRIRFHETNGQPYVSVYDVRVYA